MTLFPFPPFEWTSFTLRVPFFSSLQELNRNKDQNFNTLDEKKLASAFSGLLESKKYPTYNYPVHVICLLHTDFYPLYLSLSMSLLCLRCKCFLYAGNCSQLECAKLWHSGFFTWGYIFKILVRMCLRRSWILLHYSLK